MITTRVDRRRDVTTYNHWVYGLYLNNELVYVGVTADPAKRAREHSKTKNFDEIRLIKGFSSRDKADEWEKYSIMLYRPTLNVLYAPYSNIPSKISAKDLNRFWNNEPVEFDITTLSNKSIKRRLSWELSRGEL